MTGDEFTRLEVGHEVVRNLLLLGGDSGAVGLEKVFVEKGHETPGHPLQEVHEVCSRTGNCREVARDVAGPIVDALVPGVEEPVSRVEDGGLIQHNLQTVLHVNK